MFWLEKDKSLIKMKLHLFIIFLMLNFELSNARKLNCELITNPPIDYGLSDDTINATGRNRNTENYQVKNFRNFASPLCQAQINLGVHRYISF